MRPGLVHFDVTNDVLACKAHIGRLRTLDGRRLDDLERDLKRAFASRYPRRNGDDS